MNEKKNRVLVVGGGSGIARALVRELLERGDDVIVGGRHPEALGDDAGSPAAGSGPSGSISPMSRASRRPPISGPSTSSSRSRRRTRTARSPGWSAMPS